MNVCTIFCMPQPGGLGLLGTSSSPWIWHLLYHLWCDKYSEIQTTNAKKAWTLFDSDVVVIVNTSFLAEMGESPPILSPKYMFISLDEIWSIMICLIYHTAYFQLCSKYLKKYICYSFLPGSSSCWKIICFEVCQLCSYARGLSVVAISANYVLLGPSPTYYAPLKTRVT